MLIAQHAVYLETRRKSAHDRGQVEEEARLRKDRDAVLYRLCQFPSEKHVFDAWVNNILYVETMPAGSARVASGAAQ